MNSILVLGGSPDSLLLIGILKEQGYTVVCCDIDPHCAAALVVENFHQISTFDFNSLVDLVDKYNVKYCVSRSSGIAAVNCYKLNQYLLFNEYSEISMDLTNKQLLKDFCDKASLFYPSTKRADCCNLNEKYQDNIVLKPLLEIVGKQTTYLIHYSDSAEYRLSLLEKCRANSYINQAIIQEHIVGEDITLLGYVCAGRYVCYAQFVENNRFEDGSIQHTGFVKNFKVNEEALAIANRVAERLDLPLTPLNLGFRYNGSNIYLLECNLDFGGEGILESLYETDNTSVMEFFRCMAGVAIDG